MRRYTLQLRIPAVLKDGTPVLIAAVQPKDEALVSTAFAHLSETSRYRRFLQYKSRLTVGELRALTAIDGEMHYALSVVRPEQEREPLGIGRMFRSPDGDSAELAVAVMDEHQGQGVGRLLMNHLLAAARERGIARVQWTLFVENEPMVRLIRTTVDDSRIIERDGPVVTMEAAVGLSARGSA